MFDFDFKRMCTCLFCACLSYYSVNPRHLIFIDNIENFENYPYKIEMFEELLRELNL